MAKTVVTGGTNWLDRFPKTKRADIVRMMFSLATSESCDILVAGQHWQVTIHTPTPRKRSRTLEMSATRWASLMNLRPE